MTSVVHGEMNHHSFIPDEMEVQDNETSGFLNLPNEMQVAIIDKVIEDGLDETTAKTLQLVCKGLREIAATSVGAFLKSLCTSVSDGILHAKVFSLLIPNKGEVYGEGKYVWKHLRKTVRFIRKNLKEIRSEVDISLDSGVLRKIKISVNYLNNLQTSIHSKLNKRCLQRIWARGLRDDLLRLPQTQPPVKIPTTYQCIRKVRDFLNDPNNANFLFQLKILKIFNTRNGVVLPPEIGKLTGLNSLCLSGSGIRFLPETIGNLKGLKQLDLRVNNFKTLPDAIGNLSCLEKLDIRSNDLIILPDAIGDLRNLKDLSLALNELTALPDAIGNLANLEKLSLVFNKLHTLPDTIGNLRHLKRFNAHENPIEEIPHTIAQWNGSQLEEMEFERDNWDLYMPFDIDHKGNILRLIPDNLLLDSEKLFILVPRIRLLEYADQASERLNSPLARLYQLLVLKAASLQPESAKDFFYDYVPPVARRAIFEMFLECAGHLCPHDQQLQQPHLFDETIHRQWTEERGVNDPGLLFAAVRGTILKQLNEIPQDQKQRFYELVTEVAGKSNSDPEWGERKAEHYLAFAAEAMARL